MNDYLFEQNLHWLNETIETGTLRDLLQEITPLINTDQIIAVSGIRRCGKSFLMKQIINHLLNNQVPAENILFVNLEYPSFAFGDQEKILDQVFNQYLSIKNPSGKLYVFLDEIQTIYNWETWIKYKYDLKKGDVKFFVTGSNSQLLSSEFATKLSGRVIEKTLYPFSFSEVLRYHDLIISNEQELSINKEKIIYYFNDFLKNGGMPETLKVETIEIKREILLSYFNTIIFKDIIPRFSIRNSKTINQLALYLLVNATSIMNIKKITEYLNSSKRESIKRFIEYLEQAFLNFSVLKFDFSYKRQMLSLKKNYSIDNGFINLLPINYSPNFGKLLENLVYLELRKRYKDVVYFLETNAECDFVIYNNDSKKNAFQVCYELNDKNRSREFKGLQKACKKLDIDTGYIITYNQEEKETIDGLDVVILPYWKWVLS